MIAFFCATPYQVLLAINLKETLLKNKEVDMYILNHFNSSTRVVNKLKMLNLFKRVEHVNCMDFNKSFPIKKKLSYFKMLYNYLTCKNIAQTYFKINDNTIYDEIYFTYPYPILKILIQELYKRNSNLTMHIYEDGAGGYDSRLLKVSMLKKKINKLFTFGYDKAKRDILIFKPELYSSDINISIYKMPKINSNKIELKKIINMIFEYQQQYKIEKKIIFLEQPFRFNSILNDKIAHIANQVLKENYIIKLHPRSNSEAYRNLNIYQYNSTPWEVINLNNDIEDKILISYYSTACFSSKIIFDKEPTIILLYNLTELSEEKFISKDRIKFVNKFKRLYRDQSKIFVPNNIAELEKFLNSCLHK